MAKPDAINRRAGLFDSFRTKGIVDIYQEQVRTNWDLRANWPPGSPLDIGDYGTLDNGVFKRIGNIKDDYKIKFRVKKDPAGTDIDKFCSSKAHNIDLKIKADASGAGVPLATGMSIKFADRNVVFIDARDCRYDSIVGAPEVNLSIIKASEAGTWDLDYYYVTRVMRARQATVIITMDKNATIDLDLEASTPIPVSKFMPSMPGLTSSNVTNIGFKEIGKAGMALMMDLWHIVREDDGRKMAV